MRKIHFLVVFFLTIAVNASTQSINEKLQKAYRDFETDSQLSHAISSLYVINAKTGEIVFDKNSQVGLAPASTQKIITATTAFERLGKNYKYETRLEFSDSIIVVQGAGDPTLGSWRYPGTSDTALLLQWSKAIAAYKKNYLGIKLNNESVKGNMNSIPDGYIWQDIGNYYGAGTCWLNWHENQYDIFFESGKPDRLASIKNISPKQEQVVFYNEVKAGEYKSGDNAYIYCPPYSRTAFIQGTIPPDQKSFSISGAMPDPAYTLGMRLRDELIWHGIYIPESGVKTSQTLDPSFPNSVLRIVVIPGSTHYSPPLDSIIYWFLRKSINLYGEALLKTIGLNYLKEKEAEFDKGVPGAASLGIKYIKLFWKQRNVDENELNICDGSGLSPLNRVTTHAQVEVLKYAQTKDWYPYFYNALPEYNGMKMKSGTISDAKAFCGYQKSKDGNEYIFSFLVNNYNGPSSGLVNKMYKVLDVLK